MAAKRAGVRRDAGARGLVGLRRRAQRLGRRRRGYPGSDPPGFKHDLYGSSHVWIQCNADFKAIQPELERYGLKYLSPADQITGHPDRHGGPGIVIYRSIDKTCDSIAQYSKADATCCRRVHDDFALMKDGFRKAFFSPPSPPSTMARALEASHTGLKRLQEFSLSARAWVEMNFETTSSRR